MKKLITWVEIPTNDFESAVHFYSHLLQIELESQDFGTEKMACFPGNEGAIIYHPTTNHRIGAFCLACR